MTVYAITDTKQGRTGIAPTYLQTTLPVRHFAVRKLPIPYFTLRWGLISKQSVPPYICNFCGAMLCISATYAAARLSVCSACPSVTFVYFVEMRKDVFTFFHGRVAAPF